MRRTLNPRPLSLRPARKSDPHDGPDALVS
jgi:hypothetical protein